MQSVPKVPENFIFSFENEFVFRVLLANNFTYAHVVAIYGK